MQRWAQIAGIALAALKRVERIHSMCDYMLYRF
jgi:hypothetical protein